MKKAIITITLISTFVVCFGLMSMSRNSAKLNGSWVGVAVTTAGNCRLDYKFLTIGNHFVGTAISPQGEATIVDGTINNSDITFSINFKGHEVKHTGKYNDANNTIAMDLDLGGAKLHAVLVQGK